VSRVVAIGRDSRLAGYALAGAVLIAADGPAAVTEALEQLAADVALVILEADPGGAALAELERRPGVVWCSLPA
jgi:vacuolar-type H+-ATPase subunit F/Vma7